MFSALRVNEVLFESIDFTQFRVEAEIGDRLPAGYFKAVYHGFTVFVHEESGMFAASNFIEKYTPLAKRYSSRQLFNRDFYEKILSENGFSFNDENVSRDLLEGGIRRFIFSSRLFWICLHWMNRKLFIESFFERITGLPLLDSSIFMNLEMRLTQGHFNYSSFYGLIVLTSEAEETMNWVSVRDLSLLIHDRYDEEGSIKQVIIRKDRLETDKVARRFGEMNVEQTIIQAQSRRRLFASPRSAVIILEERGRNGNWIHL